MSSANPNDFLSAFYDREAAPNEELAAKALVEGSPEAAREVKDYQRISRLIQELPRLAAPPEFAAAVMQRAERESLIPLDPVEAGVDAPAVAVPAKSLSPLASAGRRRWILAGATSATIATVLFVAVSLVNRSGPKQAAQDVAQHKFDNLAAVPRSEAASNLARDREVVQEKDGTIHEGVDAPASNARPLRVSTSGSDGVPARAGEQPSAVGFVTTNGKAANAGKAASFGIRGTENFGAMPAKGATTFGKDQKQEAEKLHESGLMLPANLKTAKVGDVVEALQQDGQQVAVVRLTVVNQVEGLDGVQSLLVRNTIRTLQNVDEIKRMRQQFVADKSAEVSKGVAANAADDLICVYVEGSRDKMLGVLQDLQNESHIQGAELTNTISFSTLEEYANSAVNGDKSASGKSADKKDVANPPLAQTAPQSPGSQLAVRLPASTVDKILSARQPLAAGTIAKQPAAQTWNWSQAKSAAQSPVAQQFPGEASEAPRLHDANDSKVTTRQLTAGTAQKQSVIMARRSASGQYGRSKEQGQSTRPDDQKQVAGTQKSFQIFFVITDQSPTQATTQAPTQPQTQSAPLSASQSRPSVTKPGFRPSTQSPGQAPPATPWLGKSAAPNKTP